MGPEQIYTGLVNSPLSSLLEEVVALGIFVVGLSYLRHAMRDPDVLWRSAFFKRALLLGCVVLFVTYIAVAYEVDLFVQRQAGELGSGVTDLPGAKRLILTILPIDLLGVGLTAGLFAVLSLDDLRDLLRAGDKEIDLNTQIFFLFLLTGLWHGLMIAWWLVYGVNTFEVYGLLSLREAARQLNAYDLLYHSAYALGHLSCAYLWVRIEGRCSAASSSDAEWRSAVEWSSAMEWWGVGLYGLLVTAVYLTRLSTYVEKYALQTGLSRPALGAMVWPAAVCCGVLGFLFFQNLRARWEQMALSS